MAQEEKKDKKSNKTVATKTKSKTETKAKKETKVEAKTKTQKTKKTVSKSTKTADEKTKKTTKKVPSTAKKINKQAKKEDEKIKKILAEQLANIEAIEENEQKKIEENSQEVKVSIQKKRKKYNPEEIAKKIENKKKLPTEQRKKIYKKIAINIIIAWAIVIYFIFVNLGSMHIEEEVFITDLKVFSLTIIAIAIIVFENAYNKDSGKTALFGIETFIVAIATLVSIYIYILHKEMFTWYIAISSFTVTIYYLVKSTIIAIHNKKEYKKTISDVKEIIQED